MGFEDFCEGKFWDLTVTWNTEDPGFTKCFQSTVLAWIPAAVLILITPFEVKSWLDKKCPQIPLTVLNVSKTLLTVGLVFACVAELIVLGGSSQPVAEAEYVGYAIQAASYLYSLLLLVLALRNGCITSGPQFLFWFLNTGCQVIIFRSTAKEDLRGQVIPSLVHLLGSAFMFLLNCFADQITDQHFLNSRKPCPNYGWSFFSNIFYSWCTSLIWTGYRRPLIVTDLWDISPEVSSQEVVPQFEANYKATINVKSKKTSPLESPSKKGYGTFEKGNETIKFPISIFPALVKTYGGSFMIGAFLKLCCDVLNLASPKVMKLMINFVESHSDENKPSEEKWKGFFYGGLLFCTVTLQSLMMSQYFERMFVIGVKVRTTLISALYKKSLKISPSAKKESTVGEIVNLMSVDVQKFMDILPYANMIWSSIFQIGLATFFIYQELGWPAFIGVGILFVSVPLNGYLSSLMRRFQLEQMKLKDKRIKMMNEILGGMKVLKLYAWEPSFINQIGQIRGEEIKVMKKAAYFQAFMSFFWTTAPFMVGLGAFTTFLFINGGQELTAQKAFVTLSYLNIMRIPMALLPMMIAFMVQAKVSLDRVNKFMNNDELDENAVKYENSFGDSVSITEGNFKWGSDEPSVLKDINVSVKKGSLTAVVGTVGCGKSSLISAMLGEMHKESGVVTTIGKVAYVPQQAWIQNLTLKDNILFCSDINEEKYDDVLDACALRTDLEILPAGDLTEIGEKGINLSGGQKQRVSLARAVYSESDLYLLDDPLSAVDSHVGKHIFENVIGPSGVLKNTTRILVTHGITFLPKVDYIIVMKDGRISEQGSYKELMNQKDEFASFILEYRAEENEDNKEIKQEISKSFGEEFVKTKLSTKPKNCDALVRSLSLKGKHGKHMLENEEEKKPVSQSLTGENLIEKEAAETGSVKMKVYLYYMRCIGIMGTLAAFFGQAVYSSSTIMVSYWMTWWTSSKFGNASEPQYRDMYLGVYGGIGLLQSFVVMGYSAILALTTLNASKILHKKMLARVMMSPMSFFDTTPLGRIINRFAKDVDVCDQTLPGNLRQWLSSFANFVSTIITIMTVIPLFIVVILPIAVVFFFIQKCYVNTSRQLKRLESISRSPIYSHFGESITGSSTIRAFGKEEDFILQSEERVDANQVAYFPSIIANRWLAVRLELLGNLVTLGAAMFVIFNPDTINPSQVGLVITYSLNITQNLNWLVRMTSEVETNIVGVERLMDYTEIEQEAPWVYPNDRPSRFWPEEGKVEFKNFSMRYRDGLDLVVKDITCKIKAAEKVGIVGRTGAGKSTLTVALFRIVESALGSIEIDGTDISDIGLHDLRNKLTIIPQDPVLFSGTLRMNLDPFSAFTDLKIWEALEHAHLKSFVADIDLGLEHEVQEGGGNLSVGQRQLVCLARALLRKTKVLILDEATAAVDLETDDLIQATIRKEFVDSTVLTIAHRLNTIMDYDKIMVLDKGLLVEFDTPNNLLNDKDSIFHGMAVDAGLT